MARCKSDSAICAESLYTVIYLYRRPCFIIHPRVSLCPLFDLVSSALLYLADFISKSSRRKKIALGEFLRNRGAISCGGTIIYGSYVGRRRGGGRFNSTCRKNAIFYLYRRRKIPRTSKRFRTFLLQF